MLKRETRKWGVPTKASTFIIAITIESQKFRVKTTHGLSSDTYQYSEQDRNYGAGQGLGWSGALWMATSNTIYSILKDTCAGMRFESPIKEIVMTKCGDMFVDDTALGITENCVHNDYDVPKQLHQDRQKYALALFGQGHQLSLPKCCFYLSKYERDVTTHRHKFIHELPGTLILKEGCKTDPKQVKILEPFATHKH